MIGADGTVYVDTTIMKAVAECSSHAVLRHVLHRTSREERAILVSGTAGHEALATYFKAIAAGSPPLIARAAAKDTLIKTYSAFAEEHVPSDDRLGFPNVFAVVEEWLESRDGKLPFRVTHPDRVEIGFAYPLDEEGHYVFFGRIDLQAIHLHDGAWYIVDHKFTGRIDAPWVRKWHLDPQITGYLWAAKQHHPEIAGALVNAIELAKLPTDPHRKCKTHALPYSDCGPQHLNAQLIGPLNRSATQFEEWRQTALQLARRYELLTHLYSDPALLTHVRMQGPFTGACRYCEFHDFCAAGRPVAHLDTMFETSEWRPYNPEDPH